MSDTSVQASKQYPANIQVGEGGRISISKSWEANQRATGEAYARMRVWDKKPGNNDAQDLLENAADTAKFAWAAVKNQGLNTLAAQLGRADQKIQKKGNKLGNNIAHEAGDVKGHVVAAARFVLEGIENREDSDIPMYDIDDETY